MKLLLSGIDRSSRLLESLAVLLLYAYCALMLAEVFARGFLGKSLPYSWEFSTFAMASVFLLASGPALRAAVHVRVSLLLESLPPRLANKVDLFANALALVIVAIIVSAVYNAFSTSLERGLVSPSIVRTPLAYPQGLLLLGAVQLWLDLFARLIRLVSGQPFEFREQDSIPGHDEVPHKHV